MIWYDMIWYDMIWYGMIWYDMIWYVIVWSNMIWYDINALLKVLSYHLHFLHFYRNQDSSTVLECANDGGHSDAINFLLHSWAPSSKIICEQICIFVCTMGPLYYIISCIVMKSLWSTLSLFNHSHCCYICYH